MYSFPWEKHKFGLRSCPVRMVSAPGLLTHYLVFTQKEMQLLRKSSFGVGCNLMFMAPLIILWLFMAQSRSLLPFSITYNQKKVMCNRVDLCSKLSIWGSVYIMAESRKSTKKVAENRKKETNSVENWKGEVLNPGKQKKKATESQKNHKMFHGKQETNPL